MGLRQKDEIGIIEEYEYENEDITDNLPKNQHQCLLTNEVGTRWYKSPELLYGTRKYDFSIDIWSAGCIIAELLQCQPLFCGETDIDQLCKIFNILGTIDLKFYADAANLPDFNKIIFNELKAKQLNELWPTVSVELIDLIECCLRFNPCSRIVAADVLKHPWFVLTDHVTDDNEERKVVKENDIEELKQLIQNATIALSNARKAKRENFVDFHHQDDDDDGDEIISITSEILNECDLLEIDPRQ